MLEKGIYDFQVILLQGVKDRLPYFFALDDAAVFKLAQLLRDGGHGHLQHVAQVAHAQLPLLLQQVEDLQPRLGAGQAQHLAQLLNHGLCRIQLFSAQIQPVLIGIYSDTCFVFLHFKYLRNKITNVKVFKQILK